jgi:hypothetical protein
MYQLFYKTGESANSAQHATAFRTRAERAEFAKGPEVYWYHLPEDEDWCRWTRGGAWQATARPGPADVVPEPPEITEDDRW